MLKLLLSTDWVANRDEILRLIANDVASSNGNRIFIVPELVSHDTERRLCAVAGDTACRFAEVLSFTRLANRVAEVIGCPVEEHLDNGGRVVAVAAAVRQVHNKLKAYASLESRPEFLVGLLDAVDEFKRCCIAPKDLMDASKVSEGSFAQKLEELSLIYEAYNGICDTGKKDPRDQMTWLLEQLEICDFAENHTVYIDGFPDFTRQHMAILEHFICNSPLVVVGVNCDKVDTDGIAFEKAADTALQIIQCARRNNIPIEIVHIKPRQQVTARLCDGLFQGKLDNDVIGSCVELYRTHSVYQECLAAVDIVNKHVHNGCRYRDVAIVCGDLNGYRNALQTAFSRCNIPLYLSGTESILEKPTIRTLLAALDAALGGFEQGGMLRYLKSALSPVSPSACDLLENYVILWGINGSQWTQPWTKHPMGLGLDWNEKAKSRLAALNDIREQVVAPLVELRSAFQNADNLSQQVKGVYRFLEKTKYASKIAKLADDLDEQGNNREAQILNQLWEILILALEQLYDMLGQTVWDAASFLKMFRLLLSQYDVGTIPPVLDAVTAGAFNAMRCHECRHLIILGACEGNMPSYTGATGVLSDQERIALRKIGVPLTGGATEGIQAEFADIYGVFCGADTSVTLLYSEGQPSFIFKRLANAIGAESVYDTRLSAACSNQTDAASVLVKWNLQSVAEQTGMDEAYQNIKDSIDHSLGNISADNVRKLYGDCLRLSASQIDKHADCKLLYFLRYGLHAEERKIATVDPAEFGTYVHAVLENLAKEVVERGGFRKISVETAVEIAKKHSDAYAAERFSQLDGDRLIYLLRRNEQELLLIVEELWQELQNSDFQPVDFEVGFGLNEKMPPITIPGAKLDAWMRGYVDRVDAFTENGQSYFRVVDYKTGKKDFDYCDVYNGIGLQMLLYMFALEQGGDSLLGTGAKPAGVQYFPARVPVVSADNILTEEQAAKLRVKEWKRKGLLLDDMHIVEAMDSTEGKLRLCCGVNKSGELTGDIATREQFSQLKDYMFLTLRKMVDSIASGDVTPDPYTRGGSHNPCTYCPYGAICHPEDVPGRRNYKAMKNQEFWKAIGEELKKNGGTTD